MEAPSQPAYLRLPFRLAFNVASARARLSAILRRSARLRAALRSRTRLASQLGVNAGRAVHPALGGEDPAEWAIPLAPADQHLAGGRLEGEAEPEKPVEGGVRGA